MTRSKSAWLEEIAQYPELPGVYIMRDADHVVLYVGKANKIIKRLQSYFSPVLQHPKTEILVRKIEHIEYILTDDQLTALVIEQDLIKKYQPKYNILLKDDKTYPYVMLTGDAYPRLVMVRGALTRLMHIYPQATFLGPFPIRMHASETLEWLQKILQLRNCRDYDFNHRTRPCLQYQIERCSAPCVGYISQEKYQEQARLARDFLLKNDAEMRKKLEDLMQNASDAMDFEAAARYRDMLLFVQQMYPAEYTRIQGTSLDIWDGRLWGSSYLCALLQVRNGMLSAVRFFEPIPLWDSSLWDSVLCEYYQTVPLIQLPDVIRWPMYAPSAAFCSWYKQHTKRSVGMLKRVHVDRWRSILHNNLIEKCLTFDRIAHVLPREGYQSLCLHYAMNNPWIIAIDISHTQGFFTIGAMASFVRGSWDKKTSKTFPLTLKNPGNDIEAMVQLSHHILRLCKRRKNFPDVIVVDGSVTQLKYVVEVLYKEHPQTVYLAVAKDIKRKWGEETLYSHTGDGVIEKIHYTIHIKHTLLRIRDASHSLAHDAHAKLRESDQLVKNNKKK